MVGDYGGRGKGGVGSVREMGETKTWQTPSHPPHQRTKYFSIH